MTLSEIMEIWDIQNPENNFWEDCRQYVPQPIDFDALVDFLVYNHADSYTVYAESDVMHDFIVNFFKIHNWNIEKLAKSLEFQYDPIQNERFWLDRDQFHDETDTDSRERTEHMGDERTLDTGEKENTKYTRDDTTTDEYEKTVGDVTDKTENQVEQKEEGKEENTSGETVHYVSAFNDIPSREGALIDTEEWRETTPGTTTTQDNSYNTTTDTTSNTTENITENYSDTGTLDRDDNTDRTLSTTEHEGERRTEHEGENKKRVEDEENHQTDFTHGMHGTSFQDLVTQEREQAQFNIYKWIDKHFSRECVLPIW